ncbi:MAG: hypothetical protein E6G92_09700 [Alphaproteobacteria bacterium]|nr:MAG: hypothetical protein E6G92_09700 [Alphaproteobacteria bacterium]
MKRAIPFLAMLLATTACGQAGDPNGRNGPGGSDQPANAANTAQESGDIVVPEGEATQEAGPNIGTVAAPDVAFAYRYGFGLAADRIAEVQDQHQQICERYTLARCRITGMTYRAANSDDVEASLTFALDPAIARTFARDAVQRVNAADGTVTQSEITGEDAGTPLRANQRDRAEIEAELARIETRLRGLGPMAAEKTGLEARRTELLEQLRPLREAGHAGQESLATTPMVFRYGSGNLVPGPAQRPSIGQAFHRAGNNFADGATMLLVVIITLLPWAIAFGLIALLIRYVRRRWFREETGTDATHAA